MYKFFRNLINDDMSKREYMDPLLSFKLNFSHYRRKQILDAIMLDDSDQRKNVAQNILNNFERQINQKSSNRTQLKDIYDQDMLQSIKKISKI